MGDTIDMYKAIGQKILAADKISHDYLASITEADLQRLSMIGRAAHARRMQEKKEQEAARKARGAGGIINAADKFHK